MGTVAKRRSKKKTRKNRKPSMSNTQIRLIAGGGSMATGYVAAKFFIPRKPQIANLVMASTGLATSVMSFYGRDNCAGFWEIVVDGLIGGAGGALGVYAGIKQNPAIPDEPLW